MRLGKPGSDAPSLSSIYSTAIGLHYTVCMGRVEYSGRIQPRYVPKQHSGPAPSWLASLPVFCVLAALRTAKTGHANPVGRRVGSIPHGYPRYSIRYGTRRLVSVHPGNRSCQAQSG